MNVSLLPKGGTVPARGARQSRCALRSRLICRQKIRCQASSPARSPNRRDFVLKGINVGVIAALFAFGGDEPTDIGVQDIGDGQKGLALCPPKPNCISTASGEKAGDDQHYVPPWTYNPIDGRGRKNPVNRDKAFEELIEVIQNTRPDNFTPTVVKQTDDYIHVEYESPFFGFKDDAEFWFPSGSATVEYRSASRLGDNDNNINRKRIRELRKALEQKGWSSKGFA